MPLGHPPRFPSTLLRPPFRRKTCPDLILRRRPEMQQCPFTARLHRDDNIIMKKRTSIALATMLLVLSIAFYAYRHWSGDEGSARATALAVMPASASTVVFGDFAALRQSPFAVEFFAWAPRPQIDADYAQFLRDTGFDYERDLDRVAIAAIKHRQDTVFFVVADGRFDRKKISAYAAQTGMRESRSGREIFSVPISSSLPNSTATSAQANPRKISFTFLHKDRLALTDSADLAALLSERQADQDAKAWRERFERLAGSPLFAVIRQDAAPGSALASRAPGGFQSQQLSTLLDQLQWITIAGKPEGERLRVVTEGECSLDTSARQLADFLNGVLMLAQAGLNGPQVRQQLDPQAREAYLEMLKSADVSRLDRGETKSVRLVFDVTPNFLQAARAAIPVVPQSPAVANPQPKTTPHK
jgi:hypothetical protein